MSIEDPGRTIHEYGRTEQPTVREPLAQGYADSTVHEQAPDGWTQPRRRFRLPPPVLEEFDYVQDLSSAGSEADVVLCRRRRDGLQVAIKLYRQRPTDVDRLTIDRLRALSAAEPEEYAQHVVPILAVGEWAGETWEVQEYLSVGSLTDLYARRPGRRQTDATMREILEELFSAIRYLHGRDLIHRDLKPDNILVRHEKPLDLVIGDFGMAREQAVSRVLRSVAGTYAYMAPEASSGVTSKAGDWWSLGAILYEGLAGRHLLSDASGGLLSEAEMRAALNQGTYTFAAVDDPRWNLLLRGLITHRASDRWGSAQVEEWINGGSPAVADRPTPRPIQVHGFVFSGRTHATPAELAAAFRADSAGAAELLTDPRSVQRLRKWLGLQDLDEHAQRILTDRAEPGAALVQLLVAMDPGHAPVFSGHELTAASLQRLASSAQRGNEADAKWIRQLREEQVLASWAEVVEDGAAVGYAAERLRRWWTRIDQLSDADRETLGATEPAVEGLLMGAALSDARRTKLEADNRKRLADLDDVPTAFGTLAQRERRDGSEANFGVRTLVASQIDTQRGIERARLEAVRDRARTAKRSARSANRRQRRARARTNARSGATRWFFTGIPLAVLAVVIRSQLEWDRTRVVLPVVPWLVGFAALGAVLWAVRPHMNSPVLLVALGLGALMWLDHLLVQSGRSASGWRPDDSLWQSAFHWAMVASIAGWAATFVPRYSAAIRLPDWQQRVSSVVGTALAVLWVMAVTARLRTSYPAVISALGYDGGPMWYRSLLGDVATWTAPVAALQPAWVLPTGLALVFGAVGLLHGLVLRSTLGTAIRPVLLVLASIALLFIIVGNAAALASPLLTFGILVLALRLVRGVYRSVLG